MAEVKRPYDATSRQERARERRLAVVRAAQELFERDGFRTTTIAAVARAAGVSAESVYKGFGTKAALAKAVFDLVIAGDDDPVPVAERSAAHAIQAELDVRRKIALYAESAAIRGQRSAKVQLLIRDGRHVDDTLEDVWQNLLAERLTGMGMLATHLHATGQLRSGAHRRGGSRSPLDLHLGRALRTASARPRLVTPPLHRLAHRCPHRSPGQLMVHCWRGELVSACWVTLAPSLLEAVVSRRPLRTDLRV